MYDSCPFISVSTNAAGCCKGWEEIGHALRESLGSSERRIVCVECYPGVFVNEVRDRLSFFLKPLRAISTDSLFLDSTDLNRRVDPMLTDDPVFGVMNGIAIKDYFDTEKLRRARQEIATTIDGLTLIVGTGAVEVAPHYDVLV